MLRSDGMGRDERPKQVAISIAIFCVVGALFALIALGGRLPGAIGVVFAKITGILSTPFLMEASLCFLGLVIVMLLNYWRHLRNGDELVYLDEIQNPPVSLPDSARWAVYKQKPLDPVEPTPADLLEGAIAIGDHVTASEALESMSDAERARPEIVRLRIALARATGKADLAKRLESELGG